MVSRIVTPYTRSRTRERIAEARAAPEYVIIIGSLGLPSDTDTHIRTEGGSRVGRLGSGSHARHTGERKGSEQTAEEGRRRKREFFYCSTSRLKVAFPDQWADSSGAPLGSLVVDNAT